MEFHRVDGIVGRWDTRRANSLYAEYVNEYNTGERVNAVERI